MLLRKMVQNMKYSRQVSFPSTIRSGEGNTCSGIEDDMEKFIRIHVDLTKQILLQAMVCRHESRLY